MNQYIELERIRAGYFGTEHRLKEKGLQGKERMAKLVPVSKRGKAKWVLEQYYRKMILRLPKHENLMKIKAAFLHRYSPDEDQDTYLCTVWKIYDQSTMNLNDYLLTRHSKLRDDAYKSLMLQLARALEHLHSNGTAHNALTPYSVMVIEGGKGEAVLKVGDYGLTQVCGSACDEHYQPDGDLPRILQYYLPPEAYQEGWGHAGQANTTADVFMLGLLFSAMTEHSVLESDDENKQTIVAPYVKFPGYGAVPIGKFLKTNPSVNLDRQLYRKMSPELRSLVRRMTLIEPESRPPANGIIHMLTACDSIFRDNDRQSTTDVRLRSATSSSLTRSASTRKRPASSAMFNLCASPPQIPRMRSASVIKPPSATATKTNFIRRASIRASNYLRRSRSVKISN